MIVWPAGVPDLASLLIEATRTFGPETAFLELDRSDVRSQRTYDQVRREAQAFAAWLEDLGVGKGDRVAIWMSNQPRWGIAALGAFLRGAVVVPLDARARPDEVAGVIRHAKPAALVADGGPWAGLSRLVRVPVEILVDPPGAVPEGVRVWGELPDRELTAVAVGPEDPATIVYSSGTGGRPKGCVLPHRAYLAQLVPLLSRFPMKPGQRFFSMLPTNHAIDFTSGFLAPLCCGATVVHQRTLRPEFVIEVLRTRQITHTAVVPMLLEAIERSVREKVAQLPAWQRYPLELLLQSDEALDEGLGGMAARAALAPIQRQIGPDLVVLFCGGAWLPPARQAFFRRLGWRVVVGYGLTEACTVVALSDSEPFRPETVGRVVEGVELRIKDPGPDGVGEVQVRGPTLMQGYLDDPDLTDEAFDEGWLRTGDLGVLDGSFHLRLVGRSKDMIVTAGGKNVYPEDIQARLDGLPVEELVVVAANTLWPRRGLEGEELIAVVRPKGPLSLVEEALRSRNRRLGAHQRLGGWLAVDEAFPRTASMKVKRNQLFEALRQAHGRDAVRPLAEEAS